MERKGEKVMRLTIKKPTEGIKDYSLDMYRMCIAWMNPSSNRVCDGIPF